MISNFYLGLTTQPIEGKLIEVLMYLIYLEFHSFAWQKVYKSIDDDLNDLSYLENEKELTVSFWNEDLSKKSPA